MNRIAISTLVVIGLVLETNKLSAQQVTIASPEASVLHRSYASVAPNKTPIGQAEASTIAGNFPSLSPQPASQQEKNRPRSEGSTPFSGSLITVGSSLAVVLGLFAALVWVTRRFAARSMPQGGIPTEVMQALGSSPIDARTRLTLVRCGNRILILAQTATGVQPISEINDPNEVRQLTALCLSDSKKEFASTLQAIEKEQAAASYVDGPSETPPRRSPGRLFTTA